MTTKSAAAAKAAPTILSEELKGKVLNVNDAPDYEAPQAKPIPLEDLPPSMKMASPAEQLGQRPPVVSPATMLSDEQRTPSQG